MNNQENYKKAIDKIHASDELKDKAFDQFISEDEDHNNIPRWIHIGYKNGSGKQRQQFLYMKNGKYYTLPELLSGDYL